MEKNSKQLRISQNERAEDPEVLEEEEKMEKFYELIRRFNEARRGYHQCLRTHLHDHHQHQEEGDHEEKKSVIDHKKKVRVEDDHDYNNKGCKMMASWMPSFKWEDFGDVCFQDNHDDQTHDNMKKKRKIDHALDDDHDGDYSKNRCPQNGLDLNLTL